jgi:HK97 family phage major capsid protein
MNELEKLTARLKAIDARLDELLAADELTAEAQKEHDDLLKERAKVVGAIGRARESVARAEERANLEAQAAETATRQRAAEERSRRQAGNSGRLTSPDAPPRGGAAIVGELAAVPDPRRGFRNHREFLTAVMDVGIGRGMDQRLSPLRQAAAGSDEGRGISDPAGGFLIPEAFSPNLLQIMPEADPMAGLTTDVPMQMPIVNMPARVDKDHRTSVSGGFTVTRRPETVPGTASQATFERVKLVANELFGLSYVTEELLTDSPLSFIAIISQGFSQQFTYQLINERINGTGIGEYEGVLNAPCLVSVPKETGQAGATLTWENIGKMRSRCWGYGNAVWLANHDTLPQFLLLNQSVGTGGSAMIWQPSAREGEPDRLLGRPLIFTEYCATLGTVGDLILSNWREYLEGTYQPMQSAESIHVRFVNHERAFKFWLRNAGAPWWKTALTPKNSTSTLSPFVVLATRA